MVCGRRLHFFNPVKCQSALLNCQFMAASSTLGKKKALHLLLRLFLSRSNTRSCPGLLSSSDAVVCPHLPPAAASCRTSASVSPLDTGAGVSSPPASSGCYHLKSTLLSPGGFMLSLLQKFHNTLSAYNSAA